MISWVTSTDHKRIGTLYICTAFGFFGAAVIMAMLMRTQLIRPQNGLLSPAQYNQIFTMHGTTMVFLFAMPMLAGLANYLVPLMIGARDMAFPRLNAFSYWVYLFAGLLLYSSFIFGGAPDTGWFSYAPLTERLYSAHNGVDFWILSLAILGVSSMAGAINIILTTLRLRAPGMRLRIVPMYVWANFINSFLILFAIPSLTAGLAMLYLDRHYNTHFFDATGGGDPIVWQHLFWFFGHPEVYILILPAFGILSEVVPVFSRKPLFGRSAMMIMIMAIGVFGFTVWAHHMFAVGLGNTLNALFAGASMLIAIPTGVKVFNWLATMWGGSLRFKPPLLFATGFIGLFTIGGLTGVTLAVVPFDWQVTDSYYLVGHFHNVLFGGTLFGVLAGIYYWYPKVTGRLMNERLGKVNFWLLFMGFNFTFLPMYVLGVLGMPRRVYTYQPGQGWEIWNLVSTLGGYVIALGVITLLYNLLSSLRRGAPAGDDPWDAWTLEWATTSPPPPQNFDHLPPVRGPRPLWDLKHPDQADWRLEAAALDEPAPARTLALAVPERSGLPALAAAGLVSVAAGGLGSPLIPILAGIFLFAVLVAWAYQQWEESPRGYAGQRPAAVTGTLFFIASEAVFFAALFYTYVHLRLRAGGWPPSGLPSLDARIPTINTLVLLTSGVFAHWAFLSLRAGRRGRFTAGMAGAVGLGVLFLAGQAYEWTHAGFGLSDGVMGSTFFTLTGFHGAHVVAGILVLLVATARVWRNQGANGPDPGGTPLALAESGTYYWHFVDAVWLVLFTLVYVWPPSGGGA
jgi:cytochrome c oxidase subunit I